jgi:hypothetical protein
MKFTKKDLEQFTKRGITHEQVMDQIHQFEKGFPFLPVIKAALPGDGIRVLTDDEVDRLSKIYDEKKKGLKIIKFVPASGAATRMFKDLYETLYAFSGNPSEFGRFLQDPKWSRTKQVCERIREFAFSEELDNYFRDKGSSLNDEMRTSGGLSVLRALLFPAGLNYGNLPKGLLKFHKTKGVARTSFEEHMVEGSMYARQDNDRVWVHYTISPEHEDGFRDLYAGIRSSYESMLDAKFHVRFSHQKASTDTMAVDMKNKPFRCGDKSLLFRPGGHGALLENLNELDADLIFIKNIDNVAPDSLKGDTVRYKKALAGLLLYLSSTLNIHLTLLEEGKEVTEHQLLEAAVFLEKSLSFILPPDFYHMALAGKRAFLIRKLNRPLRICGMVKNEGEPGGGPFWVKNKDGSVGLQIAESSQFNMDDPQHARVFREATHFNPVDLVCRITDHHGNRYPLHDFRDPETGFISVKSKDGKDLKALELPGLWNGAMADWNTVFVEVPPTTFNPVKTINDLLRKEHLAG